MKKKIEKKKIKNKKKIKKKKKRKIKRKKIQKKKKSENDREERKRVRFIREFTENNGIASRYTSRITLTTRALSQGEG